MPHAPKSMQGENGRVVGQAAYLQTRRNPKEPIHCLDPQARGPPANPAAWQTESETIQRPSVALPKLQVPSAERPMFVPAPVPTCADSNLWNRQWLSDSA